MFYPHSNQNSSFIQFINCLGSHKKISLTFLFPWLLFYHCHRRQILVLMKIIKYKKFVYRFQNFKQIQLSIQDLLIVVRKPIRNSCFWHSKTTLDVIVWQWTNRRNFHVAHTNISNSRAAFYINLTCLLRHILYIWEIHQLLLLFNIISSWST